MKVFKITKLKQMTSYVADIVNSVLTIIGSEKFFNLTQNKFKI